MENTNLLHVYFKFIFTYIYICIIIRVIIKHHKQNHNYSMWQIVTDYLLLSYKPTNFFFFFLSIYDDVDSCS